MQRKANFATRQISLPLRLPLRSLLALALALALSAGACSDDGGDGGGNAADDSGSAMTDATADVATSTDATPNADTGDDAAVPLADAAPQSACEAACAGFANCYADISSEECIDKCESATSGTATKKCLDESNHCDDLRKCLGIDLNVVNEFQGGTSSTKDHQVAGDFFVKTARGSLSFSQRWTGTDNWFFVARSGGYTYTENLWNSSFADVFKNLPKNSQLVFIAFKDKDGELNTAKHIGDIKFSAEQALAKLSKKDRWHWSKRLHFVTERVPLPGEQSSPDHAGGWLGKFTAERGRFCFAVDANQRIQSCGNLRYPPNGSGVKQQIATLSYLARHLNFERARDAALTKQQDVTTVTVFDDLGTTSKLVRYVTLPDSVKMATFDRMDVDLELHCLNHNDGDCAPRSNMLHFAVCDLPSETTASSAVKCDTEIARWSLPDGREGRWITDVTPMLAALKVGGKRKFKLWTAEQVVKSGDTEKFITLKYTLRLRLRSTGDKSRPVQVQSLWKSALGVATPYDKGFNGAHPPQVVEIPADAKKVQLYALVSGHGWGADEANCATFCQHSHIFSVGNKDFALDFDQAGTNLGCAAMAGKGMAPNQYSNWQYGRAGWCTGMDIQPFVADITKAVQPGSSVKISYKSLYKGKPYEPKNKKDPSSGAFAGEILRSVHLVVHK